jgi:hypothetical protein
VLFMDLLSYNPHGMRSQQVANFATDPSWCPLPGTT